MGNRGKLDFGINFVSLSKNFMKNLVVLLFFTAFTTTSAQCNIEGKTTLNIGETANYGVANESAQCKQCHQWAISGNAVILSNDHKLNNISIKALSAGRATLSLQYFSSHDLVKCTKEISIIDDKAPIAKTAEDNCDVPPINFREVKIDNSTIAFFPDSKENLNYTWEAFYADGKQETSAEKVPQFSINEQNPIIKIQVKIFAKNCYKILAKTYDASFWKYFIK